MYHFNKKDRVKIGIILALIIIDAFIGIFVLRTNSTFKMSVTFLDVGQGDAIFIETPDKKQILIDAGPNRNILRRLPQVMPVFDRTIDMVLLSHPDLDHIGGMVDVFQNYNVSDYFYSSLASSTAENSLMNVISEKGVATGQLSAGDILEVGEGVYIKVLWPDEKYLDEKSDTNERSLVLKVIYGDTDILLTGDAPQIVEKILMFKDPKSLESDILKVGHHGSKTSSMKDFISAVQPVYSVISSALNNKFGHPHIETLDVLNNIKSTILETSKFGNLMFISDGESVKRR